MPQIVFTATELDRMEALVAAVAEINPDADTEGVRTLLEWQMTLEAFVHSSGVDIKFMSRSDVPFEERVEELFVHHYGLGQRRAELRAVVAVRFLEALQLPSSDTLLRAQQLEEQTA